MKRHYFALMGLLAVTMFVACKKDKDETPHDPVKQAAIDEQLILKYIADSSITGTMKDDTSGLHYKILEHGISSDTITLEDRLSVAYKGTLINGVVFEDTKGENTTLRDGRLSGLILGWQIGLRKTSKGGKLLLLIPSALGYGNIAYPGIPANSVLVYEVKLSNFYY